MILIIDFGGQYTEIIGRKIREEGVYCEIVPHSYPIDKIKEKSPKGIVLSEGSKRDDNEKVSNVIEELSKLDIPVLNISCENFSDNIEIEYEKINTFLFKTCNCETNWDIDDFIEKSIKKIKEEIGDGKAICALSGGVDSSVAAMLVHEAIGENLTCVFVDHGLLRKNEFEEVENLFKGKFHINLITVDAKERFLNKLKGITDPERKRKIIGEEFIRVFEEEQKKLNDIDYLVQGTIYSDVVESGEGNSKAIKSHHNVGGLPKDVNFTLVEPLRQLFKDEVREVGRKLGLSSELVDRQPFPGPGLAIRVIGDITEDKLKIVREADYIFRDEIKKAGLDKEIWQYFALLPGIRSVGVMEDERTYSYTIALRAVTSVDGMTAVWAKIPLDVLEKISNEIVNNVEGVNRVVYDITSKPPSTIEWE